MKRLFALLTTSALLIVTMACAGQKAPAEAALKAATDAYDAVGPDAEEFAPDRAKAVRDQIASARAAASGGDYAAALEQSRDIPAAVTALSTTIAAKKAELAASWTALSESVPPLVSALETRVDGLEKSRRVPAELTREIIDDARTNLTAAGRDWTDATAAATAGDMTMAVTMATAVKAKVVDIMRSLNMTIPDLSM
jgi:hypothetical protein